MAFTQFPKQQYFRDLLTDTVTDLGYFILQDSTEIKHVMLTLYVNGIIPSAFNMRLNIYGSNLLETPILQSDWAEISVSTLVPTYLTNWIGNIYLDFNGEPLNHANTYYMAVETDGYTRNADIYYVGVNLDWYNEVNNQLTSNEAGARIRILGKR